MDIILLFIPDWNLRQLYHELLLTRSIEVVPAHLVEDMMLLITLSKFSTVVIYLDDKSNESLITFLQFRKKYNRWSNIKFILLTADKNDYSPFLYPKDTILNPILLTPVQISDKIKEIVTKG